MEVSGGLHSPAALFLGRETLVPTLEAGWVQSQSLVLWHVGKYNL